MRRRYAVILEKGDKSYGAYVPDLPGCVAVADTQEEVKQLIQEAIEFHLEGMLLDGERVPAATSECFACEVDLARVKEAVREERRAGATNGTPQQRGKKK